MPEQTGVDEGRPNYSAGHLSVHVEDTPQIDVPFLFERTPQRLGVSFMASLLIDVSLAVLLIVASRSNWLVARPEAVAWEHANDQIIWIAQPGPGGGGGGGGNKSPEPARKAELPGKEKITVPVSKPPQMAPLQQAKVEPNPIAQLNIPAKTLQSGMESQVGIIESAPAIPSPSQGTGTGGGAGSGTGTGVGSGSGSGLGPGYGGGSGGGVYKLGSGVTAPIEIVRGKPQYTADAMRARIQGSVWVECVVQPTGQCTDIQVVRSLDPTFGLDQEAIKSVSQWRFKPGTRLGQPVPVLVTIEVAFTLR